MSGENLEIPGEERKCPFCQEIMSVQMGFFGDELVACGTCGLQATGAVGKPPYIVNMPICPRCLTKVSAMIVDGEVKFGCKCDGKEEDILELPKEG